ncbi:hypothetical protein FGIG_02626 [Fasciola gigantica]|uniref:PLAT domain-containing protein n=1 Tax=Fasciola gigantica TaxID=46835 RepID=A0A504YBG2_FASGI|nr:hypothetical protein FGIG_02626 [Fasciola gigantica]
MAELAAIIKEVAEKLVLYFNKRRLEVGWDDSIPKTVVGHLIPKPKLGDKKSYRTLDDFPELRKLLLMLESEGLGLDEPKTEKYIRSALEECIRRLNMMNYQDHYPSANMDLSLTARREKFARPGDFPSQTSATESFPPVTAARTPTRKVPPPYIGSSSAERIVHFASKMISNLLRLTKQAYIEQSERKTTSSWLTSSKQKDSVSKKTGSNPSSPSKRILSNASPDYPEKDRLYEDNNEHKANSLQSAFSLGDHHKKTSGVVVGSRLFTRVSTETLSDTSSGVDMQNNKQESVRLCRENIQPVGEVASLKSDADLTRDPTEHRIFPDVERNSDATSKSALNHDQIPSVEEQTSPFGAHSRTRETPVKQIYSRRAIKTPNDYYRVYPTDQFQTEPVLPRYPIQYNKSYNHADIVSNTELLQQARKYGSPNFVARLDNEIKRMQANSEEPREGYWIPKNNIYSLELFKTKQLPERRAPGSLPRSPLGEAWVQPARALKARNAYVDVESMVHEISSSNTRDFSNAEAVSNCSERVLNPNTTPAVRRTKGVKEETRRLWQGRVLGKRSDILKPPSPEVMRPVELSRSERLHKLAMATATALTQALGIPTKEARDQLLIGFDEVVRSVELKSGRNKCKTNTTHLESVELEQRKILKNPLNKHPTHKEDGVVYRLRVESVRHLRLRRFVSYRDSCSTGSAALTNPTPPMSIVLHGTLCDAPSLKLVSAELARLGEVAGQPVILCDPQSHGTRNEKSRQTFGDVPLTAAKHQSDHEGCPQVDYFAIVCSRLGRLVGVDIKPIISAMKQSRYDWYVKTITIDELGRQKRYQFYCDRWLSLDDHVIPCKRYRVQSSAQSRKRLGASYTPETRVTLSRWFRSLRSLNQPPASESSHMDDNQQSKVPVSSNEPSNLNTKSLSTSSLQPDVVGHGDRLEKVQGSDTPKTTAGSILIKFPTFYKSTDWDHLEHEVTNDEYFWSDDQLQILKELIPERTSGWILCSKIQMDVVVRTLTSPNSEILINLEKSIDPSALYLVLLNGIHARILHPEMQLNKILGPDRIQASLSSNNQPDIIQWIDVYLTQFEQDANQQTAAESELPQVKRSQSCLVSTFTDQQSPCNEEVEQQDDEVDEEQGEEEEDPPTLYAQELFPHRKEVKDSRCNAHNRTEIHFSHAPSPQNSVLNSEEVEYHRDYEDDQWEMEEPTEGSAQSITNDRPLVKVNSISLDAQSELSQINSLNTTNTSNVPTLVHQDFPVFTDHSRSLSNTGPGSGLRAEALNEGPSVVPIVSKLSEKDMEDRLKRIADCTSMKRLLGGDESNHSGQSKCLSKAEIPIDAIFRTVHSNVHSDDPTISPDTTRNQSNNNCYNETLFTHGFVSVTGIPTHSPAGENERKMNHYEDNICHFPVTGKTMRMPMICGVKLETLCSPAFGY